MESDVGGEESFRGFSGMFSFRYLLNREGLSEEVNFDRHWGEKYERLSHAEI